MKTILMKATLFPFLLFFSVIVSAQPTDDVLRYYLSNGNTINAANGGTNDLVRNAGTPALTSDRNGVANGAVDHNGASYSSTGVDIPDTRNTSTSFWFKVGSGFSPTRVMQMYGPAPVTGFRLDITANSSLTYLNFYPQAPTATLVAANMPLDNAWHHIVFTTQESSALLLCKIYIDGVEVQSQAISGSNPIIKNGSSLVLNPQNSLASFFIDDTRFYNRTITATEVNALYGENYPVVPNQIYVKENATGLGNGTSWANACTDINVAMKNMNFEHELWVAKGTYTPDPSDRANSILPKTGMLLYGGFAGTETMENERNPSLNKTILSGDLNGNDNNNIVETEASRQDNSYNVIKLRGAIRNVVLDGFTITGGNANGVRSISCVTSPSDDYDQLRGAAIQFNPLNTTDDPEFIAINCILEKNTATDVAVLGYMNPCGIQNIEEIAYFQNCIIRNNYSLNYEAMWYTGNNLYGNRMYGNLTNCLFYDNVSANRASCIYLSAATASTSTAIGVNIINCTFSNNTGVNGNVINMNQAQNTNFLNSIVWGNGSSTPFLTSAGSSNLSASIVEGGQIGGTNSNPNFNDAANDDYTLTSGSPALETGVNGYMPITITLDLAGNPRFGGVDIDLGAYEAIICNSVNVTLNGPTIANGSHFAGNNLNSNSKVATGSNVKLYAGNQITLNNNFEIEQGADVYIDIKNCIEL